MYDYSSRPTDRCTVLDPLGAQALCQLGHLSGCSGEDVLCQSTSYIFIFYLFSTLLHNFNSLARRNIFCLAEVVSLDAANIIFDKAVQKVIKDAINHVHLVSTTLNYTEVLYHSL
jgi:hypothetical protein